MARNILESREWLNTEYVEAFDAAEDAYEDYEVLRERANEAHAAYLEADRHASVAWGIWLAKSKELLDTQPKFH